jgi:hypothetical protein
MLNFLKTVAINVAIAVGFALWQAKPGERLKDSREAAFAVLAISLAVGLAMLMGVEFKGPSN